VTVMPQPPLSLFLWDLSFLTLLPHPFRFGAVATSQPPAPWPPSEFESTSFDLPPRAPVTAFFFTPFIQTLFRFALSRPWSEQDPFLLFFSPLFSFLRFPLFSLDNSSTCGKPSLSPISHCRRPPPSFCLEASPRLFSFMQSAVGRATAIHRSKTFNCVIRFCVWIYCAPLQVSTII